ncbi:hypothetical protein ACWEOG_18745 [Amycolatopsis japonica]
MRNHFKKKLAGQQPGRQMPPRHKLRICERCNAQMGKTFENSSADILKSLIDGEPLSLDQHEQKVVAGWTAKTMLLTCLGDGGKDGWGYELARQNLLHMMESGELPMNTSIRLGEISPYNEGNDDDDPMEATDYVGNIVPISHMPKFAFFGVNVFGSLVCEALTGVLPRDRYVNWTAKRDFRLVRIWPRPGGPVEWPPPETLSRGQIAAMRRAFVEARTPAANLGYPRRRVWRNT